MKYDIKYLISDQNQNRKIDLKKSLLEIYSEKKVRGIKLKLLF